MQILCQTASGLLGYIADLFADQVAEVVEEPNGKGMSLIQSSCIAELAALSSLPV
jgi:hypothetical protein